ncbi:hypothetical protein NU768_000853 [Vibrio vulnificus]|nr:hypothetical protein [Vibrio vulnificus]
MLLPTDRLKRSRAGMQSGIAKRTKQAHYEQLAVSAGFTDPRNIKAIRRALAWQASINALYAKAIKTARKKGHDVRAIRGLNRLLSGYTHTTGTIMPRYLFRIAKLMLEAERTYRDKVHIHEPWLDAYNDALTDKVIEDAETDDRWDAFISELYSD